MDPFLEDEQSGGGSFDPIALLRLFWRRKWLFIVPFVICLAMAFLAIRTMTPIFESYGAIHAKYEPTQSRLLEEGMPQYRRGREIDQEAMTTIQTIVISPKFLRLVVQETGLDQQIASRMASEVVAPPIDASEDYVLERAVAQLRRKIRVRSGDVPHVFEIAVRDPDPQQAQALARFILDKFLEEERATRTAPRTSTRDFLERQRQTYQTMLQAAEDSLSRYQRSTLDAPLAGNPVNSTNINAAEQWLRRMRDELATTDRQQLAEYQEDARPLVGDIPDPARARQDVEIAETIRQLVTLNYDRFLRGGLDASQQDELGRGRVRLNNLLDRYVAGLYPQLGQFERNRVTRYLYSALYRQVKQEAVDDLTEDVRAFRNFTTRQPEQSARLEELQELVEQRRSLLENIEREIAQQTISLEASMAELGYRLEVWRDPRVPRWPVEPDKLRLYVLGFGLSVAMGLGLLVLTVILDRSFTSVAAIESGLGLKVIGTLPMVELDLFERDRKRRVLRWILVIVTVLAVAAVSLFVLYPRWS